MTGKRVSDMTDAGVRDLAASRPVTYFEASSQYGPGTHKAGERFNELTLRALLVSSEAKLKARGEWDESKHGAAGGQEALTVAESLEVLAIGEVLARYYRHPSFVHDAVKAGATWEQIAAATGTDEATARRDYRDWVESQHRLLADERTRKFAMDDDEYAAAIARASADSRADAEKFRLDRAGGWCSDCDQHPAGACDDHLDDLDRAAAYRKLAAELGHALPYAAEEDR